MSQANQSWPKKHMGRLIAVGVLVAVVMGGWMTQSQWRPHAQKMLGYLRNDKPGGEVVDDHADPAEPVPDTLTLTQAAWDNIGLVTGSIKASDFVKVVSVPAVVVERPGRSQVEIAATMTGIVTQVYSLEREAVEPGQPLFDLRLTHEDVVAAQSEFLSRLQTLDMASKEMNRLKNVGPGILPGKRLIEQEYKLDEAEASLAAIRQSLLLHGMSQAQIDNIESTRNVLTAITIVAPPFAKNHEHDHDEVEHQYHIQTVKVNRGESVEAGALLAVLADHCLLYVEGQAFEDDANRLFETSRTGRKVEVVSGSSSQGSSATLQLSFQSVADQVDHQSRALKFYLLLPNQLMNNQSDSSSRNNFVAWKYRPGQRMEAKIPTSKILRNKIVLPADAVVIEGPNAFVFEQNGDNFDRIDVRVLFRDSETVVLENDGLLVGSVIAMNGAYQMHLALKNQAGGAVDPHAGHNH
ncbi:MAG: cobalt-zinc-cadmium efflux system membrane fusion protein [Mariniblastus sp.]|jgi:cobalt-zinc-cadmium efflux system membrane fusion protein